MFGIKTAASPPFSCLTYPQLRAGLPTPFPSAAAPPFAVFEGWVSQTLARMFIRHRHVSSPRPSMVPCPSACIVITAADTCTSSPPVVYHRRPFLGTARRRYLFLRILEQVRVRYGFVVVGYVVMPEHIHLLISEPERGTPSTVMRVVKQRFARQVRRQWRQRRCVTQSTLWQEALESGHVWQKRLYDFVVRTEKKRIEKLRYIHRNPVKRGLVLEPDQWAWSSFRWYAHGEPGPELVNEQRPAELKFCKRQSFSAQAAEIPTLRKPRRGGAASVVMVQASKGWASPPRASKHHHCYWE
jgi:putative transposase